MTYSALKRHIQEFKKANVETLSVGGNKQQTVSPTAQQIRAAITSLSPGQNPFVILRKGANGYSYMQAYLENDGTWAVEYQEGHIDKHFHLDRVATTDVVTAFVSYLRGEDAWRSLGTWQPWTLTAARAKLRA